MSDTPAPAEGCIVCEERGALLLVGINRPAKYFGFSPRLFCVFGVAFSCFVFVVCFCVGVLFVFGLFFFVVLVLPTIAPFMQKGQKLLTPGVVVLMDLGSSG